MRFLTTAVGRSLGDGLELGRGVLGLLGGGEMHRRGRASLKDCD